MSIMENLIESLKTRYEAVLQSSNFFSLPHPFISFSRCRASLRVENVSEYNNLTGLLILV